MFANALQFPPEAAARALSLLLIAVGFPWERVVFDS